MKKLWVKGKRFFLDIRFRNKILIVYIVLLAIPMIITSMLFYGYLAGLARKQAEDMIANSLKQGAMYAGSMLREMERLGDVFYQNSNIQSILARKNNRDYDDLEEYRYISGALNQIGQNEKVYGVKLYIPDWKYYAGEKYYVFPFSDIESDSAVKEIRAQEKMKGWSGIYEISGRNGTASRVLSYVVFIVDLNNVYNTIGALRIDLLESTLAESIGKIGIEGKGMWGIAGKDGKMVTSFGSGGFHLPEIVSGTGDSPVIEKRTVGGKYSIVRQGFEEKDWILLYAAPSGELSGGITEIRLFTMLVFVFLSVISLISAVFISDRMTAKITGLSERMQAIQRELKGQGAENIADTSKDEVGMLNQSFDLMVEKLRKLFVENYQAQLEKKEARLKLLQAQINPHFLYNVLDQINWMAVRANELEICDMATNLGKFYSIGLSKGKDMISLGEELEHVRLYTGLQKYRLGDAVRFGFTVDDRLLELKITKLVLQPLVENAIVHGILETEEQTGEILIEARWEEGRGAVLIKDSAGRLKPEKVRAAIAGEAETPGRGYGLKNVDERLRLCFGDDWGLEYYLDASDWSVFKIRIPVR